MQQASQSGVNPAESPKLSRTRSFDNIHKSVSEEEPSRGNIGGDTQGLTRTSSDPNLSDLKMESTLGTSPKTRMIPPLPLDQREDQDPKDDENEPITNGHTEEDGKDEENEPITNGHTEEDGSENEDGEEGLTNGYEAEEESSGSEAPLTNGVDGSSEECEQQQTNEGEVQISNGHDVRLSNGLTNGHTDEDFEEESPESSPMCSTPRKSARSKHILDVHMESSTETVTEGPISCTFERWWSKGSDGSRWLQWIW